MATHSHRQQQQSVESEQSNPSTSPQTSRSSPGPQYTQPSKTDQQAGSQSDPPEPTIITPTPRLRALQIKQLALQNTLADLQTERLALLTTYTTTIAQPSSPQTPADDPGMTLQSAKARIQQHIALLHTYNGIKDIGQGLMGMLAEQRGVQVKEVMRDFGVGEGD